jgi:hypothetical protein
LLHSEGLEKRQGHRVLAVFGAFRFLLRGSTTVQHPFARKRNLSHFLEVLRRVEICNLTFSTRREGHFGAPVFLLQKTGYIPNSKNSGEILYITL